MPPKLYRDLRKCASCGKNKETDGVTLLQCKACGVDFYCSKECQTADWPLHKTKCKVNRESQQRLAAELPGGVQDFDALRRWSRLHRPALQYLSAQELGIYDDPGKGEHTIFFVTVRPRLQETNERKKFEVTRAVPFPIAETGQVADSLRTVYRNTHATNSRLNHGTYLVVVLAEGWPAPNVMPMGFELGSVLPAYHPPNSIIERINSGRVL
ncbi:hypothetical protein EIP86_001010 [Pleurotus ostreatoroseus]|nr:hypothetical protein EIP86_001010 [Pleurotus ostreatoroseus]